jgi:PmbA protein
MSAIQATEHTAPLPEAARLEEMVQDIIARARAAGADQVEAGVSFDTGLSVTVRLGETETLEFNRDRVLGLTVYFDHRKGTASTSDFGPDSIEATVRAACDVARYTSEDPCAGLADADRLARDVPDLDLYHPWELGPEQAIVLARECEAAARAVDSRIDNSEGATVASYAGLRVKANSLGFHGSYNTSYHSVSCSVIGRQGEEMQRDYWSTAARDRAELELPADVGRKAGERTVRRLGTRRLSTRTAPVIVAAESAGSLFGHFINAVSGSSLYRKSSFLLDHLGKEVFPGFMHIHEQPHLLKGMGSAPYDSEGVVTQARDIVSGGILQGYVLNSYAARKLGMQTTGNAGGVHNLTIEPGKHDLDGLLREMGNGLLVTEFIGFGVNIVTGDYSRGAAGFWIENGEIAYPVDEITVAGNLKDMFMGIAAIGNDVDLRGNVRSGSVLLDHMMIAGS